MRVVAEYLSLYVLVGVAVWVRTKSTIISLTVAGAAIVIVIGMKEDRCNS